MSRESYDFVHKALEGTALAGRMERFNAELHLAPIAPEWAIAALTVIGSQPLVEELRATSAALQKVADSLPAGMRKAAEDIVRDLADDVASSTTHAVCQAVDRDVNTMLQVAETALSAQLGKHTQAISDLVRQHESAAEAATKSIGKAEDRLNVHAHDMKIYHDRAQSFMKGVFNRLWAVIAASAVLSGTFVYAFDHAPLFHDVRAGIAHLTSHAR